MDIRSDPLHLASIIISPKYLLLAVDVSMDRCYCWALGHGLILLRNPEDRNSAQSANWSLNLTKLYVLLMVSRSSPTYAALSIKESS